MPALQNKKRSDESERLCVVSKEKLSFCGFHSWSGFFSSGSLDTGGLAFEVAEIIEAGTANFALAGDFDRRDGRRVQREDALDAGAEANAADREGGAGGAALLRDHNPFERLDALLDLFAFAFLEANVDADAVARTEVGKVFAQLRFM